MSINLKQQIETDVLIVGLGPTGLVMANLFDYYNIDYIAADEGRDKKNLTRATGIHSHILELFESLGLVDLFLNTGVPFEHLTMIINQKSFRFSTSEIDARYPFGISIMQSKTEVILKDGITNKSKLRIHHLVSSIRDHGSYCTAFLLDLLTNTFIQVKAKYIIGCDGVNSYVRNIAKINFNGHDYKTPCFIADISLSENIPTNDIITYLSKQGMVMLYPISDKSVRVFGNIDHEGTVDKKKIQEILNSRANNEIVSNVKWGNKIFFKRRLAKYYKKGRLFLAGDSAHTHSPAGGHGMNLGISDAFNLAWKLVVHLKHGPAPALLNTYEKERRRIAKRVILRSHFQTVVSFASGPFFSLVKKSVIPSINRMTFIKRKFIKYGMQLSMNYKTCDINQQKCKKLPPFICGHRFSFSSSLSLESKKLLAQAIYTPMFKLLVFSSSIKSSEVKNLQQRINALSLDESLFEVYHFIKKERLEDFFDRYLTEQETIIILRPDNYISYLSTCLDPNKIHQYVKTRIFS